LSTTTVTPSVATTSSDKMGQFLHQRCITTVDAQNHTPHLWWLMYMIPRSMSALPNKITGPMSDLTHYLW